jgi:hypothetical protein
VLQPRYRRLLDTGALLDESVRLFREHWRTFALTSAVALVPYGILSAGVAAMSAPVASEALLASLRSGRLAASLLGLSGALAIIGLLGGLSSLLWTAAVTSTTDAYLHAEQPRLGRAYAMALRRLLGLIAATLLLVLATLGLTVVGGLLFVITGFGTLGSLVALVGLLVWWLNPGARRGWLKWLIVLAAPFGLPTYLAVRWSMFVPATMIEHHGPLGALRRSGELVRGEWFRVAGVLGVASLIVAVLVAAPTYLVNIPLGIMAAASGQLGTSPVQAAISNSVSVACQILFASIGTIAYTLLFIDLRNRREGADLAERVSQLEAVVSLSAP